MRRCPYCGHRCEGRKSCRYCADLARGERQPPTMREEMRRAELALLRHERRERRAPNFDATCPKCGTITCARWRCDDCGTLLYLPRSGREAVSTSKEREG